MLNHFNFQKIENQILITNDFGKYAFLSEQEFKKLLRGDVAEEDPCYQTLKDGFFLIRNPAELYSAEAVTALRKMKNYLFSGTALHIFSV